jgi:hypothetical protein
MSCVADVLSPSVMKYFDFEFVMKAHDTCMDTNFDKNSNVVRWLDKSRRVMDTSDDVSLVREAATEEKVELARARRIIGDKRRSLHEKVLDIVEDM